jgi:hypothetical protein
MALSVMKNVLAEHDWETVGDYDPALDGDEPQWGRIAVQCRRCGEQRRIWRGLARDDPGLLSGCRRQGGDAWESGDRLIADGRIIEYFDSWLPDGRVRTRSAGNAGYHEYEPWQLYPA